MLAVIVSCILLNQQGVYMCGPAKDLYQIDRVEVRKPFNPSLSMQENMRKAHESLFTSFPNHRISLVDVEGEIVAGHMKVQATLHEISDKEHAHGTGWAIAKLNRDDELRRANWPKGDYLFLLRRGANLHGHTLKLESDELRDLLKEPFVPKVIRVSAADDTCEPYDISRDITATDWAIN